MRIWLRHDDCDPESFKQWHDAMQDEIDALWSKQVWHIVDKPKDRTPIKCRWVMLSRVMAGKGLD